jgi:hypothetical protein
MLGAPLPSITLDSHFATPATATLDERRSFAAGLLNFGNASHHERVDFIFRIFDDDNSGYLEQQELIEILMANHMASKPEVLKKAKTIMKYADKDGNKKVDVEEFRFVAQMFPSLLFPGGKED